MQNLDISVSLIESINKETLAELALDQSEILFDTLNESAALSREKLSS